MCVVKRTDWVNCFDLFHWKFSQSLSWSFRSDVKIQNSNITDINGRVGTFRAQHRRLQNLLAADLRNFFSFISISTIPSLIDRTLIVEILDRLGSCSLLNTLFIALLNIQQHQLNIHFLSISMSFVKLSSAQILFLKQFFIDITTNNNEKILWKYSQKLILSLNKRWRVSSLISINKRDIVICPYLRRCCRHRQVAYVLYMNVMCGLIKICAINIIISYLIAGYLKRDRQTET
jgi:hypothetical protein